MARTIRAADERRAGARLGELIDGGGVDALLDALPRWVIVGGKGGVGKTTCAIALASRAAQRRPAERVLLISTDPARSLATALGEPVSATAMPLQGYPGVFARQLDAAVEREAFLARWRDTLVTVVDRGTYLDRDDIVGLVDAALPGTDEAMAFLSLADVAASRDWARVIIDTAPTGHTLRLLALPETFRLVVELLDLMQDKHRFVVHALTHRYRADAADGMLTALRQQIATLHDVLADPATARLVLVTRPEPVVVAETVRYAAALPALSLSAGAVVVNAVPPNADAPSLATLMGLLPDVPHFVVPLLPSTADWSAHIGAAVADQSVTAWVKWRDSDARLSIKMLTIVGGKGGVGKTTVACALAIEAADAGSATLLVSTDPAPSVADALGVAVGDTEVVIDGVPALWARQADAPAAFAQMERRYRDRIDAVFDRMVGAGLDPAHDRRILRDLLSLAPPGIDELYALAALGETLAEGRFATIIVDPAPTGHLLRLLETPTVALDWSHRILRLMLKYKEIAALGDAAGDVLAFAKRTRAVRDLLTDPTRTGLVLVALDEPVVRREAGSLAAAVTALGITVDAVIWNRVATTAVAPLSTPGPVAQFAGPQYAAPSESPSPRGVAAIRRWRERWASLT